MRILILPAILGALLLPTSSPAQKPPETGLRIRLLNNNDGQRIIGTIQASTINDLVVLDEKRGANILVPVGDIRKLEWNSGQRRRFVKYFALGALTVHAVGAVVAALMTMSDSSDFFTPAEGAVIGAAMSSVIAIPVGVVVGLSVREDEWSPVHLPEADRMTLSIGTSAQRPGAVVGAISIQTR